VKSNGVFASMPFAPFGCSAAIVCESLTSFSVKSGVSKSSVPFCSPSVGGGGGGACPRPCAWEPAYTAMAKMAIARMAVGSRRAGANGMGGV
jgi:hypothetical protein